MSTSKLAYKVADINLADFGRKEINLAEVVRSITCLPPSLPSRKPRLTPLNKGNARVDGRPRAIRRATTLQGSAHFRVVAHDDSNERASGNSPGPWRRCALVLVQHLLHARPRRCR